jgi:small subunit ribosomal protein S1
MVKVRRPGEEGDVGEVSPQEFEAMLMGSPRVERVSPGEIVSGTVVSVGREFVFVDIGSKSEGMIAADEFRNKEGEIEVKPGDVVEATVLTVRGGVQLSRSLKKSHQTSDVLADAYDNGIPIEGRVKEVRKGGFGVEIGGGQMAFCPISQIDLKYVEKPEIYLDQVFNFRLIELSPDQRNVVVSRRAILEEEQQAHARETREKVVPGALFDGTVRKVMPFGAFVDIGGMDGLVHVSEISWDRVEDPATVLTAGQQVRVKVLKFDLATNKLSLSMKEAGADPWEDLEARFPVGTSVSGAVMRVEPYGAFVRIASGIEGLVHVSDMSWAGRVRHAGDVVKVGDHVTVAVLNIDRDKKRISLGMKQIQSDPFEGARDKYRVGSQVSGTVQRIGAGGVFVELEEGIVAFLPGSLAGTARGEPLSAAFKIGKLVNLSVREVDPGKRHITLENTSSSSHEEKAEFESYMKQQGVQKLGSFGELLQKALKDKR